jgi:hypothetical protein
MKTQQSNQISLLVSMGYSIARNETTKEYLLRHNRKGIAFRSTYQECVMLGLRLSGGLV